MPKGIKGSSKKFICLHCKKENKWKYQGGVSNKFCNNDCQQSYKVLEGMNCDSPTKATAYSYMRKFIEYKCSCCGISDWNGNPLTLQVDHINGKNTDHRKENLRWICPNCHTQTDTWGVKNVSEEGKKRMLAGARKGRQMQMVS